MAIAKALEAKAMVGWLTLLAFGGSVFQCESPRGNQEGSGNRMIFLVNQSTLESVGMQPKQLQVSCSQVNNTEIEDMLKAGQELLATVSNKNILNSQAKDQAKQQLNKLMIIAMTLGLKLQD